MDDPNFMERVASARSPEVWIALGAGILYVYRKSPHPSRLSRVIEAGISGMIGYSIGPDAAQWAGINDAISVLLVASLGYLMLDVFNSIVSDRKVIREIIVKRLGGSDE